jgi:hypothetical protein
VPVASEWKLSSAIKFGQKNIINFNYFDIRQCCKKNEERNACLHSSIKGLALECQASLVFQFSFFVATVFELFVTFSHLPMFMNEMLTSRWWPDCCKNCWQEIQVVSSLLACLLAETVWVPKICDRSYFKIDLIFFEMLISFCLNETWFKQHLAFTSDQLIFCSCATVQQQWKGSHMSLTTVAWENEVRSSLTSKDLIHIAKLHLSRCGGGMLKIYLKIDG